MSETVPDEVLRQFRPQGLRARGFSEAEIRRIKGVTEPAPVVLRLPAMPAPSGPGVYAIRSGDFVKIGRSANIKTRLAELQAAHPTALRLVAVLSRDPAEEPQFHRRLQRFRVRGEWFQLHGEVLDLIRASRGLT